MKKDVTGNTRRPVSIHVELNGKPKPPLHKFVQIDNSKADVITIHLADCGALNLDFHSDSPFVSRYSEINFTQRNASSAERGLTDSWEAESAASAGANPLRQSTKGIAPFKTDKSTPDTSIYEAVEIPVGAIDVPLAKVRWQNQPPSTAAKLAMQSYMENGTTLSSDTSALPVQDANGGPDPSFHGNDGSRSTSQVEDGTIKNGIAATPVIPYHDSAGLVYDDTDTEPSLQVVRTSIPPLHDADRARNRRPIYMVSAAALLIMIGVVGAGLAMLTSPTDTSMPPVTEALTVTTVSPGSVEQSPGLPEPSAEHGNAPAMIPPQRRSHRAVAVAENRAGVKKKTQLANEPTESSSSSKLSLPPIPETGSTPELAKTTHDGDPGATATFTDSTEASQTSAPKNDIQKSEVRTTDARETELLHSTTGGRSDEHHSAPAPVDGEQLGDTAQILPESPTRDEVKKAMESIAPFVRNCRLDHSGRLLVQLVISGDSGRVVSTEAVDAAFANSAVEKCVSKVARSIELPAFRKETITIRYPFNL